MSDQAESSGAESLGKQAGSAVRWNGAAAGATLISQLAQLLVLARLLKPSEFGLAATATAVAGFFQALGDFGMMNALVQRPHIGEKTWASALWACVLGGLVLFAALFFAAPAFESLLHLPGLTPLLCAAALTLPWAGPGFIFQSELQRKLAFSSLAKAEIIAAAVSFTAAMGWALWRRDAMALVVGQIALVAVRCLSLFWASSLRPAFQLRLADLRPLASFGSFQLGERILNYAFANFDRLLVARLLGASAAGFYTVASQIALRPLALLGPFVFRTLFPLFARLQAERERLSFSVIRSVSLLSLVSALIFFMLFGLADPLCHIVLGVKWNPVIPILRILTGLGFLLAVSNPFGSLILALGRARAGFAINVVALASSALCVTVGSRYGLRGVAWGMLASVVVLMPLDFILTRRWVGTDPVRLFRAMVWTLPSALVAALSMRIWDHLNRGVLNDWLALGAKGILGISVFFVLIRLFQRSRVEEALVELKSKIRVGG